MKICIKCNLEKDINLFPKRKSSKDGHRNECIECYNEYKREWSLKNYAENKEILKDKSTKWRKNNPDKIKDSNRKQREKMDKRSRSEYMRIYRKNNKEKILIQRKEYLKNNPEMKKKFEQNRYKNMTEIQKIKLQMRNILNKCFGTKGYIKNKRTIEILGCNFEEFKIYIESKFEKWMNWNNKGLYNGEFNYGWDIDHIIPLSSASCEEEIIKLNHYTNLQPLCSKLNREIKRNLLEYTI